MRSTPLFFAGLAVLALGVALAPGDGRCQTTTFASDATWETFAMNPDGSQGPSVGAPQFPSWAVHGANLEAIPGAAWMWFPGVNESSVADLRGAFFSKQFDLPGTPIDGQILIAVDDFAEVIVNGVVAGSTGSVTNYSLASGAQSSLKNIDITLYLVPGLNTVTVRAQDGPSWFTAYGCNPCTYSFNPAGVVFGGILTVAAPTAARGSAWGSVKVRYR